MTFFRLVTFAMSRLSTLFGRKHSCILCALPYLSREQRTVLLRHSDKKLVKILCECALNTLNGNLSVSQGHVNKLKKYKKVVRGLAKKRGTWSNKKRLIVQHGGGGFIPLLLAPIVGSLLSRIFEKKE